MKKKKEPHFYVYWHMYLPVASWPSHTGLFNAEAFYSVEIWAASVKSTEQGLLSISDEMIWILVLWGGLYDYIIT